MQIAGFLTDHAAAISLLVVGAMFAAFVSERMPPSAVASIGAGAFIALGYVSPDEALSVFSNSAAITIAAMLVISASLVRTGVLEALASRITQLAATRPGTALATMTAGTVVLSSFVNSTPVVIVLIPLMRNLAAALKTSAKRLLIPLSYAAILGGTCTLIGTSTNLLVDSLAQKQGQPAFGIFEITPVGLVAAVSGMLFLALAGRFLLPQAAGAETEADVKPDIITEIRLGEKFAEIGKPYPALALLQPRGVTLVGLFRQGEKLDPADAASKAEANDRLVLRVTPEELSTLRVMAGVILGLRVRDLREADREVARVTVTASSRAVGSRVAEAPFLSRASVGVIGVSRHRNLAGPDLGSHLIKPGDRLWLTGSPEALGSLSSDPFLVVSGTPLAKPFRRNRALVSILVIASVVVLAAFAVMPIAALALIAVALLLLIQSVDAGDAWRAISGEVLVLIFGMLMVGIALDRTGAIALIVNAAVPFIEELPPLAVVVSVYFLVSVLTEMVSNAAVAVIMTPLVLALGATLGIDPRALLLAVMFGASASFATPIGYQTNTLVYAAGDYRFTDFLKVGLPMNIIVGVATCLAIHAFFL
ncbi:MAG: SLC13 family permease [Flavobacteriaceae bacterium]